MKGKTPYWFPLAIASAIACWRAICAGRRFALFSLYLCFLLGRPRPCKPCCFELFIRHKSSSKKRMQAYHAFRVVKFNFGEFFRYVKFHTFSESDLCLSHERWQTSEENSRNRNKCPLPNKIESSNFLGGFGAMRKVRIIETKIPQCKPENNRKKECNMGSKNGFRDFWCKQLYGRNNNCQKQCRGCPHVMSFNKSKILKECFPFGKMLPLFSNICEAISNIWASHDQRFSCWNCPASDRK